MIRKGKKMSVRTRLAHAWNAFTNRDPTAHREASGYSYGLRPDRTVLHLGNERTIISGIYTRIGIDCAMTNIQHVKVDQNGRFEDVLKSQLNEILSIQANKDQTGRAFIQDAIMSMLDEGVIALVPVDTSTDINQHASFDILSIRTAKVLEWYPDNIRVRIYDDNTGRFEELLVPKKSCAIVENPLYAVMNEPNSTLKRLANKITMLDIVDQRTNSGKLDIIIQVPYTIRTDAMRQKADARKKDIEDQLHDSKFGIAYIDGTEKVIQLNRPAENNLLQQIAELKIELLTELGMTENVMKGTAEEAEMLNYFNRTIAPCLTALVEEMRRKFLTKTARTQGQSIMYFQDVFKLVPAAQLADIADKFTRNEILSSNEFRGVIGFKPSKDPKADELRNKNLKMSNEEISNHNNPKSQNESDERDDEDGGKEK